MLLTLVKSKLVVLQELIEWQNITNFSELKTNLAKKQFLKVFVEEVQIFPDVQPDGKFLRSIKFGFPIPYDGSEVQAISWDKENTVETVALMERMQQSECR